MIRVGRMSEALNLGNFKPNSREGRGTKVQVKATGKIGYVDSVVDDKFSKGLRIIYADRPGMYPEFFKVDEVSIVD